MLGPSEPGKWSHFMSSAAKLLWTLAPVHLRITELLVKPAWARLPHAPCSS